VIGRPVSRPNGLALVTDVLWPASYETLAENCNSFAGFVLTASAPYPSDAPFCVLTVQIVLRINLWRVERLIAVAIAIACG
jgi:hypothetical protein